MVEKLKSILKQTNWSLLLKALIFAVAWWALPFWLFAIIALYLYFIPITGTEKVAVPFLVLILLCYLEPQSIVFAPVAGIVFYAILLVKDLIIIDRRTAYEMIILVLTYLLIRGFFLNVGSSFGVGTLIDSVIAAWAVSVMVGSFVKNFSIVPEGSAREARSFRRMLGWMTFLLMWQLLIVGIFLPLNFLYQSAVVFLVAAILIDLVPQYVFGELSREKVLATGSILFALLVIVAASARWII